jgi:hypothetical protein
MPNWSAALSTQYARTASMISASGSVVRLSTVTATPSLPGTWIGGCGTEARGGRGGGASLMALMYATDRLNRPARGALAARHEGVSPRGCLEVAAAEPDDLSLQALD